uniref:Uncharacterized protein n=1 Tax=Arundo donax TaxID=35708 RepID=A0A0A9C241_ARUDO
MSLEMENSASTESTNRLSLKRHDSLFGDAEKVSGGKYHGSEVGSSFNLMIISHKCSICNGTVRV